jgi:hypothetical protein
MIEPSSADFYQCPEVVQEYIKALEQRLSQAEAENQWRKEAMDNHDSRLTVHLLRNWDKEKRERFCVHILGDYWQDFNNKQGEAK